MYVFTVTAKRNAHHDRARRERKLKAAVLILSTLRIHSPLGDACNSHAQMTTPNSRDGGTSQSTGCDYSSGLTYELEYARYASQYVRDLDFTKAYLCLAHIHSRIDCLATLHLFTDARTMSNTNSTDPTKPSTSSSCASFSAFKQLGQTAKQKQPAVVTPKSIVEDMSKKVSDKKEHDEKWEKWERLFKDRDERIKEARAERGISGDWK